MKKILFNLIQNQQIELKIIENLCYLLIKKLILIDKKSKKLDKLNKYNNFFNNVYKIINKSIKYKKN